MKNGDIMNKLGRIKTGFLYIVFICYILLLIKILFLSRTSQLGNRSINLIPLYSIMEYIVGNIVFFTPLGTYLSLFKNDKRVLTNLSFIFIVSLSVEIIQGLLGIGASDIDNIILNCLGGLFGILGYKFLLFLLRDGKKVRRIQIANITSDAIREYLVDTKSKNAIDFGCGTGLVGMNLLNNFSSILFVDTSQNMINQIKQKVEGGHLLIVDFNKNGQIVSDIVHNGFDQIELASTMTKIGYKNIQSKTFFIGSKIFMGQDASMFILDSQK